MIEHNRNDTAHEAVRDAESTTSNEPIELSEWVRQQLKRARAAFSGRCKVPESGKIVQLIERQLAECAPKSGSEP